MDYPLDGSPSTTVPISKKLKKDEVQLQCIHCWHSVPVNNYSTWGTLSEEVCCHCGTRRNLHGPYAPSPYSGFQVQTRLLDG